jgi:hypothetical protein
MKHISEILPKVVKRAEVAHEINNLTSRHIAKILSWLNEKNIPLNEIQESAVKKQFRFLQDDIITLIEK